MKINKGGGLCNWEEEGRGSAKREERELKTIHIIQKHLYIYVVAKTSWLFE